MAIDVWNAETFDDGLLTILHAHAYLAVNYFQTARAIEAEREASSHMASYKENPFYSAFSDFEYKLTLEIESRKMRAWHYTRLTDAETKRLKRIGIEVSTKESLIRRLSSLVACKQISQEMANMLFCASPLHGDQFEVRSGRFWLRSHPAAPNHGDVSPLLRHWGGEVTYFWQENIALLAALEQIGQPRIIEAAIPIAKINKYHSAARSIISTFTRSLGVDGDFGAFDLQVSEPLGPEAILKIHSQGQTSFENVAALCV